MTAADDYINRVLDHLPRGTPLREQIAMELRGNIAERLESGQPEAEVLRQLGDPTTLAESYLSAVPLVSASFLQRGAAKLIDVSVVMLTILLLIGLPTYWVAERHTWPFLLGFGMFLMILAASFGFGLYTIVAEHWLGFTLGKRALGLRVVRESGAPIGLGQSIVRTLPMFLQIYWIDVMFAIFTDKKQRAFELLSKTRVVIGCVVAILLHAAAANAQTPEAWTRPFPPFKLIGNIYWVGSYDLSTYLVTTPQGHILINTGVGDTAQQIKASVEQLGFRMADVKILTATHGHWDHVAGMAALKKMTGAALVVSEPEKELLESGGKNDFRWGNVEGSRFEPVAVDRTFKDGGTVALGGTRLTAHLHPGHTKGATSFTTEVRENGKTYRVVIANLGSINPGVTVTGMPAYPGIEKDYARTFAAQRAMTIDVFLASHASQFGMHQKYKPGDPYNPDRFVDPKGFTEAVARLEKAYLDQVLKERAGKTGVQQSTGTPTIDQLISLKRAGSASISPNGQWVAYTVRDTNWDDNAYHTEIWLADAKSGELRQLTSHPKKSSTSPTWSPDSTKLAFATDREEKRQIYVIDPRGGEARKLTSVEEGVGGFAWAPDGTSVAFTSTDAKTDADKDREKKFGDFDVVGEGYRMSHLWVFDIATEKARRLTSGTTFTVGQFSWSPDGTQIAFDHRINSAATSGATADISVVSVADGNVRPLVTQAGADNGPVWSPDGSKVAFESAMTKPFSFLNNAIGVVPSAGGRVENLTNAFDENPSIVRWTPAGLFFSASQRTWAFLYSIDPATRAIKKYTPSDQWIGSGFSLTPDGQWAAFSATDASTMSEIYVAPVTTALKPKKLTNMTAQTAAWAKSTLDVVSWKSQDGATIEGVLHKPIGFQPGKKYPLLVVIHGGPTGISRPNAYSSTSIYPIDIWNAKGALVLEPNYRGSAGYGEAFRSLNVRNLGVGDAWDVLSGIDYLIKEGLADPNQVGTMGWSQGGYISAFLTTHDSARFKAVSVGAGISDWMTYYVNTDITQFTRHYLKATPWDDPEIYAKTSPITYVKNAKAPTLIQHGATDQRVPAPNAFQLYRGLQDVGVPSKLIIYKGFEGIGHGPSKPKSSRALMQHNLEWFDKYMFPGSTTSTSQDARR